MVCVRVAGMRPKRLLQWAISKPESSASPLHEPVSGTPTSLLGHQAPLTCLAVGKQADVVAIQHALHQLPDFFIHRILPGRGEGGDAAVCGAGQARAASSKKGFAWHGQLAPGAPAGIEPAHSLGPTTHSPPPRT